MSYLQKLVTMCVRAWQTSETLITVMHEQVLNDDCLRELATEIIEECETCKGDKGEMVNLSEIFLLHDDSL